MLTAQKHLGHLDTVNLGSFYTPKNEVEKAYSILLPHLTNSKEYTLLDTSSGYGNFFNHNIPFKKMLGFDIDKVAIETARRYFSNDNLQFCVANSLLNVSREKFKISNCDKLVIVGNPPYNDRTSIIQNNLKNCNIDMDRDLFHRDLGVSFLMSYSKLSADFICVLHPLSYLIKRANFNSLKAFTKNYILIDSQIISSQIFATNANNFFPIIIALYKKSKWGMDYDYIKHYPFKIGSKTLRIADMDSIANYADKYPNHHKVSSENIVAYFRTLRDINALKRSKTFINKDSAKIDEIINVTKEKYSIYCYIDIFKYFAKHLPYYMGNCDIFIDYKKFKLIEDDFIKASEEKIISNRVILYFRDLFGEHYVE